MILTVDFSQNNDCRSIPLLSRSTLIGSVSNDPQVKIFTLVNANEFHLASLQINLKSSSLIQLLLNYIKTSQDH